MSFEEQMWSKWNEDEDNDDSDNEWIKEGLDPVNLAKSKLESEK